MASTSSTVERRDLQSKDRRAWNSYAAQRRIFNKKLRVKEHEKKKLEELIEGYQYVIKNVVEPLVQDLSALRRFSASTEATVSTVAELFQSVCLLGATVAKHKHEVCRMEERIQKVESSIEINNPSKKKGKKKHKKTIARKKTPRVITPKPKGNTTTSSRREEVTTRREVPDWVLQMCGGRHPESDRSSSSCESSVSSSMSTEEFYDRQRFLL
jgi:hypothetical protein